MAAPSPEGTYLRVRESGASGNFADFGCISSLRLNREARTSEPDIITDVSGSSAWSGVVVTGKTMSIDVQGYLKSGGTATTIQVGTAYELQIQFGSDLTVTLPSDVSFVCTKANYEASGSNPMSYDISFTINVSSIC